MTVNSYLTNLASRLVLSSAEKTSIHTSISTLSTRLNWHMGSEIQDKFQFGSSTRGTILPRAADEKSDIDYMVVFDTTYSEYRPQTYLNKLRRFVEDRYSTSEVSQSHPTIILNLNHIRFELVPAVKDSWYGYKIPSPASDWSDWMATYPNDFNSKLTNANTSNNLQLKPLVRLIKHWNAQNGYPFSSYALEDYICNQTFYGCSQLKEYFYDFWIFFSWSGYLPSWVQNKVSTAQTRARNARDNENAGYSVTAEQLVEKIVPNF